MLKPHAHRPDILAGVANALETPSLYDEALKALHRQGLPIPEDHLERDWTQPYSASPEVEQAWLTVYRQSDRYWDLYQLGEKLTDLEDAFRLWRFRHVTTVERIIGFKRGRSEEHTSELQSLMRISYAVFCLKKKTKLI